MKRLLISGLVILTICLSSCGKRKRCEDYKMRYDQTYKEYTDYVINNYYGDTQNEAITKMNNYKGQLERLEDGMKNNCKD